MYMHNMSYGEARRRAQEYGATILWKRSTGMYEVTLNEWDLRKEGYFTDDAEDAYLMAAKMRRNEPRNTVL